jgi:riboflavin biosynthesis pyrimidine reductase
MAHMTSLSCRVGRCWPREGLADEMSVVIAPHLAASSTAEPLHLIAGLGSPAMALELAAVERLPQGHVWLRYTMRGSPFPG